MTSRSRSYNRDKVEEFCKTEWGPDLENIICFGSHSGGFCVWPEKANMSRILRGLEHNAWWNPKTYYATKEFLEDPSNYT